MNQISVNDLVIPICVSEYRKRNVLANMIKKRMEHPPSEYIEFLEDLAEDLYKQYKAPTESLDEKEYYENLINESIIHRNATAESQNKCSRYFNAICKIAISINDLIHRNAEIICKCLDDWMFYHENLLPGDSYVCEMYHVYFFVPILVEQIITETESIRNILKDYEINSHRILFTPSPSCYSWWQDYSCYRRDSFVTPQVIIGRDLSLEPMDVSKSSAYIESLLIFLDEKGIGGIITSYLFSRDYPKCYLDKNAEKLRFDYCSMLLNHKRIEMFV